MEIKSKETQEITKVSNADTCFLLFKLTFVQAEGVQCPSCSYFNVVPILYCKPTEAHMQMAK